LSALREAHAILVRRIGFCRGKRGGIATAIETHSVNSGNGLMKTSFKKRSGLTLIEILVIIAILVILAGLLLPILARPHRRSSHLSCVNNLKQVGLSFRIYAGDNNDKYPMNISTNDEPLVNEATQVYQYLQLLQNELGTPKILVCSLDKKRNVANSFTNLSNSNISYFIGLDAHETFPQSMLSGDRNITNGFPPRDNILDLTTNQMVGFTDEIHKERGNIALGDGSVQQVSSARLRSEIIRNSPFATNRIKLP
jgi:prepilin-type processing-associated H-X9-DG protein